MARPIIPILWEDAAKMRFSDFARECCFHLSRRGYSETTTDTYDAIYQQFRSYLTTTARLSDDVRDFTPEAVLGYATALRDGGASANTTLHRLSALSTLARYGMKKPAGRGKFLLTSDPTKTFDWPVHQPSETKYLLPAELAAFLAVPLPPEYALARDLLVETGVRASEACRASVGDLHEIGGGYVLRLVVKGRGKRRVDFPLSPGLASAIQGRLLDAKRGLHADGKLDLDAPILVNSRGQRWTRTALTELVHRIGDQAGITRFRLHAHALRHTANVVARVSGIEPYTRSRLLGHSSTASLQRYEHLIPGELHKAREQQLDGLSRYLDASVCQQDRTGDALPNPEPEMVVSAGTKGDGHQNTTSVTRLPLRAVARRGAPRLTEVDDRRRSALPDVQICRCGALSLDHDLIVSADNRLIGPHLLHPECERFEAA